MDFARKIRTARELFAYHRARSAAFAEHDFRDVYGATRERLERALGRPVVGLRMLDVGCGQRTPATLLFTAAGNAVIGIDTELITPGPGFGSFVRTWRADGLERAGKTLVRQFLFDPVYDRRLAELIAKPLARRALDLRRLSIADVTFADASFDAVISNAVFEHLPDVPAALAQVARLLRPGGVAHIAIHLFPSLSGGHHMAWAFPDESVPADVPPWDHLRANRFPAHVYLNKLKERDYRAAFAAEARLELLDWVIARTEGEALLTPEIEREMGGRYTRDDLLRREVIAIARRR
jgi:SAM-dependent methyltransferase